MRRVTRESSWGKLSNKQVTRRVGSRQIDMRAHGTQKTRTEATCSHKTETQAHGQQTNHQPCAKQDMNRQLMRKLISHMFTQDMTTWKHAANEYTSCVPHSTRYNMKTRTLTQRDRTWSVSVRTPSRNETQDMSAGIRTPRSTWNKARRRESARLEHTRSRTLTWNPDMTGVSGLCHKTMNNTRPKWQNPDIGYSNLVL